MGEKTSIYIWRSPSFFNIYYKYLKEKKNPHLDCLKWLTSATAEGALSHVGRGLI